MSAQFKPASLIVSGMSHLCPCLLPCSILPFIPFSAVTFRSISYRLGSSLHVEARLRCVIPLYFDLALRSTFAERINSQTCDSRTGRLDLLSESFYIVATLLVHSTFLHAISRLLACILFLPLNVNIICCYGEDWAL